MALAALVVYLVWFALAFGLRTWRQWRATADTGFRGGGFAPGSAQWWVRILFVAALLTGAAGPVAALAGLDPVGFLDHPAVALPGLVVALLGVAGTVVAQAAMGASWRIGVDETEHTALVTHGPFALARNPIFTTMIVTALGLTAAVPNPVSLAGLALTVVSIHLQVRAVEEPYLLRTHGPAYTTYASRVGRFLPSLGRLTP
ncbi:isoprenylcysteine carboxylmethyltransferase family protein [Actinocorallia sp. API 0066]|uniref:methyltransferase family protein n=1 Tax=Actinocorallia sp. API 0066 TaxID=2896846 RepID=UPI001E5D02AB|nr:isoprenylcysteine carboxylmethyltransferase family protein [Actinocorallia sp. API 0066]MCD0449149.1 isoprenylcysteine carboxylmethyltransferase family protein [Actinocorallia sp. API 0066]